MLDAGGGGCGSPVPSRAFATKKPFTPHATQVTAVTLHICFSQREVKQKRLAGDALSPSAPVLTHTGEQSASETVLPSP